MALLGGRHETFELLIKSLDARAPFFLLFDEPSQVRFAVLASRAKRRNGQMGLGQTTLQLETFLLHSSQVGALFRKAGFLNSFLLHQTGQPVSSGSDLFLELHSLLFDHAPFCSDRLDAFIQALNRLSLACLVLGQREHLQLCATDRFVKALDGGSRSVVLDRQLLTTPPAFLDRLDQLRQLRLQFLHLSPTLQQASGCSECPTRHDARCIQHVASQGDQRRPRGSGPPTTLPESDGDLERLHDHDAFEQIGQDRLRIVRSLHKVERPPDHSRLVRHCRPPPLPLLN